MKSKNMTKIIAAAAFMVVSAIAYGCPIVAGIL